jgi:transcriptional regulator with XRE-family HTH domain
MKSRDRLGAYLKERREALGFTQRELARQLGVKASHVAFLESGRRRPSLSLITRLADTLGIDHQELLLLAHPEAKMLVRPAARDLPKKTSALWESFVKNRALLTRYRVTMRELQALEHVSLLGTVTSVRHLLAILMLIRDIPEKG